VPAVEGVFKDGRKRRVKTKERKVRNERWEMCKRPLGAIVRLRDESFILENPKDGPGIIENPKDDSVGKRSECWKAKLNEVSESCLFFNLPCRENGYINW
jgi:hypothetical protein